MMTDAYALRHGWAVHQTGSGVNLAYRGPLWAPYATAHCRPTPWVPFTRGSLETSMYERMVLEQP